MPFVGMRYLPKTRLTAVIIAIASYYLQTLTTEKKWKLARGKWLALTNCRVLLFWNADRIRCLIGVK